MTVSSPLKWHGGKYYLAKQIVKLMPPHIHYVEPYFGSGAVLFARDPNRNWAIDEEWKLRNGETVPARLRGCSEVANDIDGELMNFWECLRNVTAFKAMRRELDALPFSHGVYEWSKNKGLTSVDRAVHFFCRCRQSLAGRMKGFATLTKTRTRRGMNEQASAWLSAIEGLPEVHDRLKRVAILSRDALAVIRSEDRPTTLFYCDPPYWPEARAVKEVYQYEMTQTQHVDLLECLSHIKGRFLLSGYRNPTYNRHAADWEWHRVDFDLPNNAAGGKTKRRMTECVWTNYRPEPT